MTALLLACLQVASAHGMDAHRLTLEVEDAVVRVTATPGVESLRSADTNGDGLLDRAEVAAARDAIRALFTRDFRLTDLAGDGATCDAASVSTVGEGADHVRLSVRCAFATRPDSVVVDYTLPGSTDLTVEAVRVWRIADNQWVPEGVVDRAVLPRAGGVALVLQDEPCPN